jgi:tRNA wybutosine-synthesizing protein 5
MVWQFGLVQLLLMVLAPAHCTTATGNLGTSDEIARWKRQMKLDAPVSIWLADLALPQYVEVFEAGGFSSVQKVCDAQLEDKDLKHMGVLMRDRKKIAKAIMKVTVGGRKDSPKSTAAAKARDANMASGFEERVLEVLYSSKRFAYEKVVRVPIPEQTRLAFNIDPRNTSNTPPPGHRLPLGSHRAPECCVDTVGQGTGRGTPSPEEFQRDYVLQNKPLHIKGGAKSWPAFKNWDDAYLTSRYGDVKFQFEPHKKEARSHKHKHSVDGASVKHEFALADYLSWYRSPDKKDSYYMLDELKGGMLDEIIVPEYLRCTNVTKSVESLLLWMSSGETNGLLHYDQYDNILTVLRGTKTVVLIAPGHADDLHVDDEVPDETQDEASKTLPKVNLSPIDPDSVDMIVFPGVQNAKYFVVELNAGDSLYLPMLWFHQIRAAPGSNIAVNLWWNQHIDPTRGSLRAAYVESRRKHHSAREFTGMVFEGHEPSATVSQLVTTHAVVLESLRGASASWKCSLSELPGVEASHLPQWKLMHA